MAACLPTPAQLAAATGSLVDGLARWGRGDLTGEDTYLTMRRLHRRTGGRSSAVAHATLRSVPGSPDRRPAGVPLDAAWRAPLDALRIDGLTAVPDVLAPDAVARARDFARSAPGTLRSGDGTSRPGTYDQADGDVTAVHVLEPFVLAQPDVQGLIASPAVAEFARRHFGCEVLVHPPSLYWSRAGATPQTAQVAARNARRFHWDYDGIAGVRLHLNLTDVDADAAPMEYLVGSHRPGRLAGHDLRNADLGTSDEAVWRAFDPSALRSLTGPAGTTFVSDSRGLHRGTQPRSTDRLFLVLPIQATGFAGYQLKPRTVVPVHPALVAGLAEHRRSLRLFAPA